MQRKGSCFDGNKESGNSFSHVIGCLFKAGAPGEWTADTIKSTFSRRSIRWISTEGLRAVAATYLTFMSSCFISLLFMRPWVFACNHTCNMRVCTYSHSSQEVQDSHENLLSLKGPCGCVQGFLSPSVKTPLPVPSLWNDAIPQMADPQLEW